jgi:low affinity Fe/Cu permease
MVPALKFERMSVWAQALAALPAAFYVAWMLVSVAIGFPFLLLCYAVAMLDGRKGFTK